MRVICAKSRLKVYFLFFEKIFAKYYSVSEINGTFRVENVVDHDLPTIIIKVFSGHTQFLNKSGRCL